MSSSTAVSIWFTTTWCNGRHAVSPLAVWVCFSYFITLSLEVRLKIFVFFALQFQAQLLYPIAHPLCLFLNLDLCDIQFLELWIRNRCYWWNLVWWIINAFITHYFWVGWFGQITTWNEFITWSIIARVVDCEEFIWLWLIHLCWFIESAHAAVSSFMRLRPIIYRRTPLPKVFIQINLDAWILLPIIIHDNFFIPDALTPDLR